MVLARFVLALCFLALASAAALGADDPARLGTANRIYDRVFPDEAAMIDYVLPYVPQDNPNAKNTASDIIRRLGKTWLHDAFVSSLALAYTLPELEAYERFLATTEGLAVWRKAPQFDRAFNQLLEVRMKAIGAI